ncbi:MAG: DsbC family protein [Thermodesulfobacteriota bacterium]
MRTSSVVVSLLLALAAAGSAQAFPKESGAAGDCSACHTLGREEAETLLKGLPLKVLGVEPSEVPGQWEVDVESGQGQKGPVYVDFSKKYLFSGNLLNLVTKENLTQRRMIELNRVDFAKIPLNDAIVIGDPAAPNKVAVFTDPDCPYCRKLHPVLAETAEKRKDVAFYVKIYSINPKSYDKAKAIACAKSSALLDDAMAGKEIAVPEGCEPAQLEANLALGRSLGVRSTPTLVFPDGSVVPGAKTAEQILQALAAAKAAAAGAAGPG